MFFPIFFGSLWSYQFWILRKWHLPDQSDTQRPFPQGLCVTFCVTIFRIRGNIGMPAEIMRKLGSVCRYFCLRKCLGDLCGNDCQCAEMRKCLRA